VGRWQKQQRVNQTFKAKTIPQKFTMSLEEKTFRNPAPMSVHNTKFSSEEVQL
jgi:hypothetical protein